MIFPVFASPILLFLPYLVLYLLFWLIDLDTAILVPIFYALHLTTTVYLLNILWRIKASINFIDVLIVTLLVLTFFIPGAYLEYPSDVWEHIRRIYRWQDLGLISEYPPNSKNKFFYFWAYSLIGWVPFEWRRLSLDILSTLSQLLLCFQIFRLSQRLGQDKGYALVQVVAFVILFGTNLFSLRYYALSSTILAYIVYLEILLITLSHTKKPPVTNSFLVVIAGLLLIYFNHLQELIFVCIGLSGIFLYRLAESRWFNQQIRSPVVTLLGLIGLGFLSGPFLVKYFPELYQNMLPGQVNALGMFKIWDSGYRFYLDTMGVHGVIAIALCAIFFICNHRSLAILLSILPVFTLVFPPTVAIYSSFIPMGYLTSRIILAFPLSLALVFGLQELFRQNIYLNRYGIRLILLIVLGLSLCSTYPWRGRLWFQIHTPTKIQSLHHLDPLAEWFMFNYDLDEFRKCDFLTDNVTRTFLSVQLGLQEWQYGGEATRRARKIETQEIKNIEQLLSNIASQSSFCGVLVPDLNQVPHNEFSAVGERSGHWAPSWSDQRYLVVPEFYQSAQQLTNYGFEVIDIPPFYKWYIKKEVAQNLRAASVD